MINVHFFVKELKHVFYFRPLEKKYKDFMVTKVSDSQLEDSRVIWKMIMVSAVFVKYFQ